MSLPVHQLLEGIGHRCSIKSPVQDLSSDYLSAGTSSESQAQQQVQSVPQPQLEAPTSVDNDVPNASPISVESGNQ